MPFLTWLFRKTPSEADAAPEVHIRVTINDRPNRPFRPDPQQLARADAAEPQPTGLPIGATDLSDTFCLLEYQSAAGEVTRRRIRMRALVQEAGVAYLLAVCLERRAPRKFRLDRIIALITEDGEVLDAATWFARTLGIAIAPPTPEEAAVNARAAAAIAAIRPGLAVLAAAARADGHVHLAEVDALQLYAEREAVALHREGILTESPDMTVVEAMGQTIALMRPIVPGVKTCLLQACDWPDARFARLRRSVAEVIRADGKVHDRERDFLDDMNLLIDATPSHRRAAIEAAWQAADRYLDLGDARWT